MDDREAFDNIASRHRRVAARGAADCRCPNCTAVAANCQDDLAQSLNAFNAI